VTMLVTMVTMVTLFYLKIRSSVLFSDLGSR